MSTPRTILIAVVLGVTAATGALVSLARAAPKEKTMVIEYIRYEIPRAQHEPFLTAYRAAAKDLAAAPECLSYEISQGVEEPDNFIVRLAWSSVEAHERGFRGGAHFAPFFAKVKPFFANIREMKHYQIAAEGKGAGAR
jgi:quinol monooxygenase YgiN